MEPLEGEGSLEQRRKTPLELRLDEQFAHFEKVSPGLNRERWDRLMVSIGYADLKNHPVGKKYNIDPLALVGNEGLLLDKKLEGLEAEKQRYILAHETGHMLEQRLESINPDLWGRLHDMLEKSPDGQVSQYVAHVGENLKPEEAEKLIQEKYAESFAQYLSSDGSFAGFIREKLNQCNPDTSEEDPRRLEEFQKLYDEFGEVEEFIPLADNPQELEIFLQNYPSLRDQYAIHMEIGDLLNDEEFYDALDESFDDEDFEYDDFVDYQEMIQYYHPRPSSTLSAGSAPASGEATQKKDTGLGDFINFWKAFVA